MNAIKSYLVEYKHSPALLLTPKTHLLLCLLVWLGNCITVMRKLGWGGGGTQVGVTPLVSYIGMCSAKGYGF